MNPDVRNHFLDWCRRERDNNQKVVDLLSTGQMRTGADNGTGWRDTTAESLSTSQRIISDMNDLISKIEADHA